MGILNRTPDSFYDRGATWDFDAFLRRAEQLVADGADLLDVGGVKAGPGPEVDEAEELDRVVPAVEALQARFDVPLSVDTWRASVLDAACARGRGRRQRHLRLRRPRLPRGSRPSTTRPSSPPTSGCGRASPIPTRTTTTSSPTSPRSCCDRARARRGGRASRPSRSCSTPASTSARRPAQSAVLLRESAQHAALGYPLLLSASNKRFIGELLGREIDDRRAESLAAVAYGVDAGLPHRARARRARAPARVCRTIEALC